MAESDSIGVTFTYDWTYAADDREGKAYEYAAIALFAAECINDPNINDYFIYNDIQSAWPFDDIVARIQTKRKNQKNNVNKIQNENENNILVLLQVKHKKERGLEFKTQKTQDGPKVAIEVFSSNFKRILTTDTLQLREKINKNNIIFGLFCNSYLQSIYSTNNRIHWNLRANGSDEKIQPNGFKLPFSYTKFEILKTRTKVGRYTDVNDKYKDFFKDWFLSQIGLQEIYTKHKLKEHIFKNVAQHFGKTPKEKLSKVVFEQLRKVQNTDVELPCDRGKEYMYAVITLLANTYSDMSAIDDYSIQINSSDDSSFNNIVVRIKTLEDTYMLFLRVEYKHFEPLNLDYVEKKELEIDEYLTKFNKIVKSKNLNNENIKYIFGLVCNTHLQSIRFSDNYVCRKFAPNKKKQNFLDKFMEPFHPIQFHNPKKILDSDLIADSNLDANYTKFLKNFYWIMDQPQLEEIYIMIGKRIVTYEKKYFNLEQELDEDYKAIGEKIAAYISDYFAQRELHHKGLSKEVFLTEIQTRHLTPDKYSFALTKTIELNKALVEKWNKVVLEHNVTIVKSNNDENIRRCLFACQAEQIRSVLNANDFDWNALIDDNTLNQSIRQKFKDNLKSNPRCWVKEPDTLQWLIFELWKYGKVPLILNGKDLKGKCLSILTKHSKRKYVLICDINEKLPERDENEDFPMKIFTCVNDIVDSEFGHDLLTTIEIPLQRRKTIRLYDFIHNRNQLKQAFSCKHIIQTMRDGTLREQEEDQVVQGFSTRKRSQDKFEQTLSDKNGQRLPYDKFVKDIENKLETITVITGVVGIGKSSVLKRLQKESETNRYIVFYDLQNFNRLNKSRQKEKIEYNVFWKKNHEKEHEENILEELVPALSADKALMVILDNYNMVKSEFKGKVRNLITDLFETGNHVLLASIAVDEDLLKIPNIETFKINPLTEKDYRGYVDRLNLKDTLDPDFDEIIKNPLYLHFITKIDKNHQEPINKFSLFKEFMKLKIERGLEKEKPDYDQCDVDEVMLIFEESALLTVVGDEVKEILASNCDKTRLSKRIPYGIVTTFNEDNLPVFHPYPIFKNFLCSQWIFKNKKLLRRATREIYEKMSQKEQLHVLHILAEDIPIHKAIIQRGTISNLLPTKTEISEEKQQVLLNRDMIGRIPLITGIICTINSSEQYVQTLEEIVKLMNEHECSFDITDHIKEWSWRNYIDYMDVNDETYKSILHIVSPQYSSLI